MKSTLVLCTRASKREEMVNIEDFREPYTNSKGFKGGKALYVFGDIYMLKLLDNPYII